MGTTLDRVRTFPDAARREAGHQLHRLQLGLEPSDWKPMSSVGPGAAELRIHERGEYRVLYVAKFPEESMRFTPSRKRASRRDRPRSR